MSPVIYTTALLVLGHNYIPIAKLTQQNVTNQMLQGFQHCTNFQPVCRLVQFASKFNFELSCHCSKQCFILYRLLRLEILASTTVHVKNNRAFKSLEAKQIL